MIDPSTYDGPPLSLSPEETARFGQCAYALAAATNVSVGRTDRSAFRPEARMEDQGTFVAELAGRLTDAHIEAALKAAGVSVTPDADELRRKADDHGGIAAYLRALLAGDVASGRGRISDELAFDALHCAAGVAEIVVGVGGIVVAASKEVGSVGILTPAAAFTAGVSGLWIAGGVRTLAHQC
jgi:hypothetical protein